MPKLAVQTATGQAAQGRKGRKLSPGRSGLLPVGSLLIGLAANAALACPQPLGAPAQADTPTHLLDRPLLLQSIGGLREALASHNLQLDLTNYNDLLSAVSGGVKHGVTANGYNQLTLKWFSCWGTPEERAASPTIVNVSVLQIYGPNFSQGYLQNLQTASGLAGSPTVRLWEAWIKQAILGADGSYPRLDVKLGQQSIDQEFVVSSGSGLFANTMMGWPMVPSADLYAGGPAYPLSSLGVRFSYQPTKEITVLGGVFDDNPPGGSFYDDAQRRGAERYGLRFNLGTGALFIGEVQYAATVQAGSFGGDGTYKLGAMFDTARFPDQRYDSSGLSLADPVSNGIPRYHTHNYIFYAVADQVLWTGPGDSQKEKPFQLSAFLRPMVAPSGRNLIDFSVNGGLTAQLPCKSCLGRQVGLGFGVANVSARARGLDRDTAAFTGAYVPVRGQETFVELTYQEKLTPWLTVQPDLQYFWMPGGGVANPANPSKRVGNELVLGFRSIVNF